MTSNDLINSILSLAFQGKLTNQELKDEPVDELLNKINIEKKALLKKGEIKHYKSIDVVEKSELPFDIPDYWSVVRIGDLGIYKKGPFGSTLTKSLFVPKSATAIKVYEQQNAIQKDCDLGEYYISQEYFIENMQGFEVFPGDVIVSCAGTIGETYILPDGMQKGIINQALMRMKILKAIDLEFFLAYFDFILKKTAKKDSKGSAIKNIPAFNVFKKMPIPLPPIDEQRRIVNAIKDFTPQIEKYRIQYYARLDLDKRLPKDFLKSVLFHAVQGKLSSANSYCDNVIDLWQHIQTIKNYRLENDIISIDSRHTPSKIDENEFPFEIPDTWKWVRLGDIAYFYSGKTPERHTLKYWQNGTTPWVSIADMVSNGTTFDTKEKVSDSAVKDYFQKALSPKGTLIMSFKLTIGKVSILGTDAAHNEAIISIFPFAEGHQLEVLKSYLFTILPFMANYGSTKNAVKGKTLNATSLTNLYIPLPSINEQEFIIKKVAEMRELISALN